MEEGLFVFKGGDEDVEVEVERAEFDREVEFSVMKADSGVEKGA